MNHTVSKNLPKHWKRGEYRGITYPELFDLDAWRKEMCPKDMHLFDEVFSGVEHYLSCDACGLMVAIAGISDKYVVPPHNPPPSREERSK